MNDWNFFLDKGEKGSWNMKGTTTRDEVMQRIDSKVLENYERLS